MCGQVLMHATAHRAVSPFIHTLSTNREEYIYIFFSVDHVFHIYVYYLSVCIYIYIERERERERAIAPVFKLSAVVSGTKRSQPVSVSASATASRPPPPPTTPPRPPPPSSTPVNPNPPRDPPSTLSDDARIREQTGSYTVLMRTKTRDQADSQIR